MFNYSKEEIFFSQYELIVRVFERYNKSQSHESNDAKKRANVRDLEAYLKGLPCVKLADLNRAASSYLKRESNSGEKIEMLKELFCEEIKKMQQKNFKEYRQLLLEYIGLATVVFAWYCYRFHYSEKNISAIAAIVVLGYLLIWMVIISWKFVKIKKDLLNRVEEPKSDDTSGENSESDNTSGETPESDNTSGENSESDDTSGENPEEKN